MSQDETRGLNKNLDFMRAISILFLVMNVYYFCYPKSLFNFLPLISKTIENL